MAQENKKQMAPTVVLASHGNKAACRDLYIHYYKNIFFICNGMTGDISLATELTSQIFIRMFESLDKLEDHNAFEQWFYSFAVNMCTHSMSESTGALIDREIEKYAAEAAQQAKSNDMKAFERNIVRILEGMLVCLPAQARTILFYRDFAGLDAQQIALIEKTEAAEAEERISAVDMLIERQTGKIREYGVDISMFTGDMKASMLHIASKKFVPSSVHDKVSQKLGIDVNPYANAKAEKTQQKKNEERPAAETKKKEKEDKKFRFTKSDFILFFGVIALVLIISSVAGHYFDSRSKNEESEISQVEAENPALLWNGAAASSFDGGSGSEADPYRIATGAQLAYLSNLVNDGNSYYAACSYILTADIILNHTEDYASWGENAPDNRWIPIGSSSYDDSNAYFTGTFDGNGHTISGLYVSGDDDYSGLFGVSRNALFKDLTITEAYVRGGSYTGGITGYYAADTKEASGFENCSYSGYVYCSGNNAGGITGYFRAEGELNTTMLSECCVSGAVYAAKGYAGGITGAAEADTGSVMIKNCFNTASVEAGKNAGGITGDSRAADGVAIIDCCYNAGKINAQTNSGGISGFINCVPGEGRVNIQSCFMLDTSSNVGLVRGDGGERLVVGSISLLTDAQMIMAENFEPLNFTDVWKMPSEGNYEYPVLAHTKFTYSSAVINEDASI